MNVTEILARAGIYSKEIEEILVAAINESLPPEPVIANPIQAEEDEWLEPLRLGGTMVIRGDM